jgi:membrane protein
LLFVEDKGMTRQLVLERFTRLARFLHQAAQRFREDRCQRVAGALSFTTVLSIVPLMTVVLAVLSLFPVFSSWMTVIQDFIYSNFVPTAGDVVQKYLTLFTAKAGRLTAIGLLFLIITAIMLMATIEDTFNDIWRVTRKRKLVHRFLTYWALLTLGPILVAVSLTVTTQLFALTVSDRVVVGVVDRIVDEILPLVFEVGGAMLLYTVVPNAPVRWRHALVGGIFAALLLEVAKRVFAASMKYFASYQIIYGAVAVLPIFLMWIYISWIVILTGAIITAILSENTNGTRDNGVL